MQEKMVPKGMLKNIFLHIQKLYCGEGVYELEDHVGQETLNSNLMLMLGLVNIIHPTSFFNCMLASV